MSGLIKDAAVKIMKPLNVLLEAISFASVAHRNQLRKNNHTPYISHPFRVTMILRHVFGVEDEKILAAAVLHDTIEDTTTDYDDLQKHFGRDVAKWAAILSKDKRMPENSREDRYFRALSTAPEPVLLIKLADLYDNLVDSRTTLPKSKRRKHETKVKHFMKVIRARRTSPIVKRSIVLLKKALG